ncbi:MAG: DUF2705 family protein [Lachnospiraceae bacterium]|nr:DUF2705 family protein [Lachnospiraceae bacterium]
MNVASKKRWCLVGTLFYIYYVIRNYIPFSYENVFAGVDYNGQTLFYASTLYLFGIIIFYGFGNTEKYIEGYGILELIRSVKRGLVIRKIIIDQIKNIFQIITFIIVIFLLFAFLAGKKGELVPAEKLISDIGLFYIVAFSIVLWQSIFEIVFDSRIGILLTMSIIGIHIYAGDFIAAHDGNTYLNLVFYSNLALTARTDRLSISKSWMFVVVVSICVIQMILMNLVFRKKDIFSSSE